ncbi:MAG: FAD-binding oxidoreductase [Candidatus Woesearchaeota archaeon]
MSLPTTEKKYFPARVIKTWKLTPSVHRLRLALPFQKAVAQTTAALEQQEHPFSFQAGHFVMAKFPDSPTERAYSISSSPYEQGFLELTVERAGMFSGRLCDCKEGDEVLLKGPYGMMLPDATTNPLICIAGGTGIAPFLSIIEAGKAQHFPRTIALFYMAKTSTQMIDHQKLLRYANQYQQFFYFPTITQPQDQQEPWQGNTGRWTIPKILQTLEEHQIPSSQQKQFLLCGKPIMVQEIKAALLEQGIPKSWISHEQW